MKILLTILLAAGILSAQQHPMVRTGLDVLAESNFSMFSGKRIGLITNPTGITRTLAYGVDVIAHSGTVRLTTLFGPEHGVRGDVAAGGSVDSSTDSATGIPVYSLYGRTRKPTKEMLKDVDILVYDIQDIGSRSYTYINTMAYGMEAAAENGIEFVVLDRPNPIGGNRVEGNILKPEFKSFVGMFPIAYAYGMTCGELATMINEEGWLAGGKKCRLSVVTMKGWRRSMTWAETGLPWVPTSPHVPNPETALFYTATGILGELNGISIGVGYTMPFQLVGAPWINGAQLAEHLNALHLPGCYFRPLSYKPFYNPMKDQLLQGIQLYLLDPAKANLTEIQFSIIAEMNALWPARAVLANASSDRTSMFDKVMGTDEVRKAINAGTPIKEILSGWKAELEQFKIKRQKYLFYE
ncbi:MAG: DUF1343 domain-containing protein [Ignavibacteriales bacterium]|nr:DUF1343 domain-containing protein [Ignavibacteriales bacterium]